MGRKLTMTRRPAVTKAPSAIHHLAAAASTNPRPAPKKMSMNTMFTRVAQITNRTFRQAHAMRKNPVVAFSAALLALVRAFHTEARVEPRCQRTSGIVKPSF